MGTTEVTTSIISFFRQNWILLVAFAIVVVAVIATWLKKKKKKKAPSVLIEQDNQGRKAPLRPTSRAEHDHAHKAAITPTMGKCIPE